MAMEDVVTGIDGLLKYINENGETDIMALASSIKVSENTIQEWAIILEKAKLARIQYKMGKMYISPASASISIGDLGGQKSSGHSIEKVTPQEMEKLIEVKSGIMKDQLVINEKRVDEVAPRITELKRYIQEAEKNFKVRSDELNKYLNELHAIKDEAIKSVDSVNSSRRSLDDLINDLNKSSGVVEKERGAVQSIENISENAKAMTEDIRRKAQMLSVGTDDLIKQFDAKVAGERKTLVAFSDSVKLEGKKLDELEQSAEQQLDAYKKMAESYRREFEARISRSARERTAFMDRAVKAKKTLDGIYSNASKKAAALELMVSNELAGLKKLTELDQHLKEIRAAVDELLADSESIKKEIAELSSGLDKSLKDKDITKKQRAVTGIEKKVGGFDGRIRNLRDKNDKINSKIDSVTGKE